MTVGQAKAYPGAEKVPSRLEVRSAVAVKAHSSPPYFTKPSGE